MTTRRASPLDVLTQTAVASALPYFCVDRAARLRAGNKYARCVGCAILPGSRAFADGTQFVGQFAPAAPQVKVTLHAQP
jgi:hypothetical protein